MAHQEVQNGGSDQLAEETAVVFTAAKTRLQVEAPKASDAVQFYKTAFGAEELGRDIHPKRKADQELPLILSAELSLAGSTILVSDLSDDGAEGKPVGSGNGVILCLETDDVDAAVAKAIAAGAVSEGETVEGEGACCGGRVAKVKDPFGYVWAICSPVKKSAGATARTLL